MTDLVGKWLGEFEVVRELGRGGMGVVFEAVQTSLHRRVALKVLGPGLGLTAKAVSRFRREAEAAAKLHHTNIVPVYATGEEGGVHFYAMELIDGPSLDRVITELREARGGAKPTPTVAPELTTTGPYLDTSTPTGTGVSSGLSSGGAYFDTVARLVADVAEALHHAHQNGVIHRDIKPGNLLLGSDGRLSINDFGLARALEEPGMTTTGEFVGTPAYMAPEQIAGGRIPVDHRCDIYSLGATLYELLTLRPPLVAERRDQLLAMVVQKDPPAPHAVNPKVPRDLETICLKCLEKDPDRRYRSAKELADDLRRYVHRFAILAKRAGPLSKLKKWVKRNPGLSAAGACVVLAGVTAGFFAYRSNQLEAQRRAEAEQNEQARREQAEQHERELREERWRAAIDRASLAAMGGDFATAEEAVREAERLQALPGQLRMLRGVVAFYQGRIEESISHLEQAVALNPESVAARALLAVGYSEAIQFGKYEDAIRAVERFEPRSPEDWLFRGYAKSKLDPGLGLPDMDEGFRQRPGSLLARVLRAEARVLQALDHTDVDMAAAAQDEVFVLKQLLTGNPTTARTSLIVNLYAAPVYRDRKLVERAAAARDMVRRDAETLRPSSHLMDLALYRWMALREEKVEINVLPELERNYQMSPAAGTAWYIALTHYHAGNIDRALAIVEPHRGDVLADQFRAIFGAEHPGGRERGAAIMREAVGRDLRGWEMFNTLCVLRLVGTPAEATDAARAFRRHPERFVPIRTRPFRDAVDHAAGELSDEALLQRSETSRLDQCNAHFCVGIAKLSRGDRAEARVQFEAAVQTGAFVYYPYDLSVAFLRRMGADPNWPRWIPHVAPMPRHKL